MPDVLVVEDNDRERERLTQLCRGAGYAVVACASAGDAEAVLAVQTFRLVLLDIGLSDKSGVHVFEILRRTAAVPHVLVFTGNPSVHLKQRLLAEGAADYLIKGTPQAHNEALLARVKTLIGAPQEDAIEGIPLDQFLARYIPPPNRGLFLNADNAIPDCSGCGSSRYLVTFAQQTQIPPDIRGIVVCAQCGQPLDPEIK
jgi:DNA-binding response OmpR family regulator